MELATPARLVLTVCGKSLRRIGFEGGYDDGALGGVTNLAARLSDETRFGQILMSQRLGGTRGTVEAKPVAALQM
jgi:hypothetical protein